MANITITTTTEQDNATIRYVADFNAERHSLDPNWVDITPVQWLRWEVDRKLNTIVDMYNTKDSTSKAELYRKASAADKATIDAILAKYA